jgi:hypothetical protein
MVYGSVGVWWWGERANIQQDSHRRGRKAAVTFTMFHSQRRGRTKDPKEQTNCGVRLGCFRLPPDEVDMMTSTLLLKGKYGGRGVQRYHSRVREAVKYRRGW